MRQLNKAQSLTLLAGALLMVAGVVMYVFMIWIHAAWIFAVGAVAFASMQMLQSYDGTDLTVRRLRRILTVSDVLFIISALFMLEDTYHVLLPMFTSWWQDGYNRYLTYIRNNWVVVLLVAAILELYATHRIAHELEKEAKKR